MHISRLDGSSWAGLEYDDIPFFESDTPWSGPQEDLSFSAALLDHPVWGSTERRRRVYAMRRASGQLLFGEAVGRCGRYASRGTEDDAGRTWGCVYQGEKSAFLGYVTTCGSVWHCPYCAARVSEVRRQEVAEAMRGHLATGGHIWMGTFTVPHHKFQSCKGLREKLTEAWRKLQSGKAWVKAKEGVGFVGSIRGLEVMHGGHGWHPHLHVLFFLDCHPRAARAFGDWLFRRWAAVVAKLGLGECSEAAWNWRFCNSPDAAGDYVAKWGADWELTHGHLKLGRQGRQEKSRSPWEILQDWTMDRWAGDADLFREYASAFKGARQLTWSKGLKARYLIAEVGDGEITESLEEEAAKPVMAVQGYAVGELYAQGQTCAFLEAVERGGYEGGLMMLYGLGLASYAAPPQKVLNGFFCRGSDRRIKSVIPPIGVPDWANRREVRPDTPQGEFEL